MKKISVLCLSFTFFLPFCQKYRQAGAGTGLDGVIAAPGETEISATITQENGGIVSFPQIAELSVGVGALDEDTTISAKKLPKPDQQGDLVPIQSAIQFGPEGLAFNKSAILKFCYSGSEVTAAGLAEKTVQVYYVDPDTGEYASVGGFLDKNSHCVSAEVNHFSTYLVAAQALLPTNNAPVIGAATYVPTTPIVGNPLRIRTVITDFDLNGAIATAYLYYRNGTTGPFTKIALLPDSADVTGQVYYADIPAAQVTATTIRFYLEATDNLGAKRTLPATAPATTTARTIPRTLGALPNLRFRTPVPTIMSAGFSRDFVVQVKDSGNVWRNVEPASYSATNTLGTFSRIRTGSLTFTAQKTGTETLSATVNFAAGPRSTTANVVVNPGQVTSIKILNNAGVAVTGNMVFGANAQYQFDVLGKDNYGNDVLVNPSLATAGGIGSIDTAALFTAGSLYADGTITADLSGITDAISVSVRIPPVVVSVSPIEGATNVSRGSPITVVFSESMDTSTITADTTSTCSGSIQLSTDGFTTCVPMRSATPIFSVGDTTVQLIPKKNLVWNSNFRVRILNTVKSIDALTIINHYTSTVGFTTGDMSVPWVVNGTINAMAEYNDTLYIGGNFSQVGLNTGSGVQIDMSTRLIDNLSTMQQIAGSIDAVIPDGVGGWYIGGKFTMIGGQTRNRLARINADGTLHPFNVDVQLHPSYPAGGVSTLYLSGNNLYIGGLFETVNGVYRNCLAAIDTTTGTLTAWDPQITDVSLTKANVFSVIVVGSQLFAGGSFLWVQGANRPNLVSFDLASGAITTFNPQIGSVVRSLASDGTTLYIGGYFTAVSGGIPRGRLAAYDIATGNLLPLNPSFDQWVKSIALSGSTLYATGPFSSVGGISRQFFAAIDANSGTVLPSFNPQGLSFGTDIKVVAGEVYTASAAMYGQTGKVSVFKLDPITGVSTDLLDYTPTSSSSIGGSINSIAFNGNKLFFGGTQWMMGVAPRINLAAINMVTGMPTAFDLKAEPRLYASTPVSDVLVIGNTLYLGGEFESISGQPRNCLAAIDLLSGTLSNSFKPDPTNSPYNCSVHTLAASDSQLYVGGNFNTISGVTRSYLVAFDISSQSLNPSFLPSPNGIVQKVYYSQGYLYASGGFSSIGGANRQYLAKLDAMTGQATSFDAGSFDIWPHSIAVSGSTLYVGGTFSTISSQARGGIAALDVVSGSLSPFTANTLPGVGYSGNHGVVNALSIAGDKLYVAGIFSAIAGSPRNNFAVFDLNQTLLPQNPLGVNTNGNNHPILALSASEPYVFLGGGYLLDSSMKSYVGLAVYDSRTGAIK